LNVPHQLKTFLDDVLLNALGEIGEGVIVLELPRIIYANEAFCRITGFNGKELLSLPSFFDLVPGDHRAFFQEQVLSLGKNKRRSGRFETVIHAKGGKPVQLELTVQSSQDEADPCVVAIVRDITEQKAFRDTLTKQSSQYQLLFQDNPHPMWIYDIENLSILAANEMAVENYGYTKAEFLTLSIKDIRDPAEIPALMRKLEGYKESSAVVKEVVRHRKKNGNAIDVEVISHPIEFEGKKARMVMVADMTEHLKAELALHESEERLRNVMTSAPIGIFSLDRDGIFTLAEGKALFNLGLKAGEVVGRSCFDIFRENSSIVKSLRRALAGEKFIATLEAGASCLETSLSPVLDAAGSITGIVGIAMDITNRRQMEEALSQRDEKFRVLFNNAIDSIFLFEISDEGVPGKFIEVNDIACSKLGYTREELTGMTPFDIFMPEDMNDLPKLLKKLLQQEHVTFERAHVAKNGLKIPVEINSHVFTWTGKRFVQAIARDITDRKRAEETIRRQAYYDVLTNLPNRMLFKDRLEQAMKHAHRNKQMLGVIVLDLDRFKNINETLGHLLGDKLLVAVAERLLGVLGESETIARFGGDEFTLLLPQVNSIEEATQHAQKIIELLAAPFKLNSHELHVTTSIGMAFYPDDGENSEILLKNAETAMYRAKEQGRNNYQLYASVMNVSAFKQLLMENSLRRALEKEEFVVYYQPQIDMKTQQTIGAEALVRWQHPDLGLVFPTEFIGLAEETGLIVPIGEWVLRKVCAQNRKWQDAGFEKVCIGVNLSARQFQQRNLLGTISQILQETGLDPQYLGLEITESIAMKNADFTIAALNELKKMRVHLSLDDFGTGYSSLSYLKRFPLETLKIDRSFVRDITTDPNDAAIVNAVIALAHSLKLKVVAEGVETEGQLAFLKDHSCDFVQGYIFSHPLSEENFLKTLKKAR